MYHTQKSKINIVSINIVAGCLIGLCVLILSYTHTTALFDRAGYDGVFAHIGVIGFEMTFILGTVTVIWSKWINEKVGGSSRFVFSLGVTVNLYSNITSGIAQNGKPLVFWKFNEVIVINEAVLIGALIPILICCAEMVVNDAIFKYRTSKQHCTEEQELQIELQTQSLENDQKELRVTEEVSQGEILQTVEANGNNDSSEDNEQEQIETKSKRTRLTEEMKLAISQIANDYFNKHGKYPTVRLLSESADCSQHMAKKILDLLKESTDETNTNDNSISDLKLVEVKSA